MEKLTEAELVALPEIAIELYDDSPIFMIEEVTAVCRLLARALTPMPCGHPGASVVPVPYIGENKSNICGWCAVEAERDALREKLKETDDELGRLRLNEAAYLRGQEEIVRDQDRLRARFKAAEGLAEAIEGLVWHRLTDELDDALTAWKAANA